MVRSGIGNAIAMRVYIDSLSYMNRLALEYYYPLLQKELVAQDALLSYLLDRHV